MKKQYFYYATTICKRCFCILSCSSANDIIEERDRKEELGLIKN